MIRVTIEMVRHGDEAQRRHLGTLEIANEGHEAESGTYSARFSKFGRPTETWKKAVVSGFPRLRLGPYDLLLRVLVAALGPRNPEAMRELNAYFDERGAA